MCITSFESDNPMSQIKSSVKENQANERLDFQR